MPELGDAPASLGVAVVSSAGATLAGAALCIGFGEWAPQKGSSRGAVALGLGVGSLLFTVGPNMGDLLSGDFRRALLHFTVRLLLGGAAVGLFAAGVAERPILFTFALAGTLAFFGLLADSVLELVEERRAPQRWLERQTEAAGQAGPGP
jgi:hypothetical protein